MNMIFELCETKEFDFKTTIHDRVDVEYDDATEDSDRNWVQLQFYHNEGRRNPALAFSADICNMIKHAYELHSELTHYDCSQDYYDSKKTQIIDYYADYALTKDDYSDISEDERLKRRIDLLKKEFEGNN